jgi:hypothetical protein
MTSREHLTQSKQWLTLSVIALQIFLFAPMIVSSFYGCAHTVEEQIIHDTDTVLQTDTTFRNPNGPAFIRLTSFIDGGGIILLRTRINNIDYIFGNALSQTVKDYTPVRNDTPFTLYAEYYNGTVKYEDSISIPADSFASNSLTSVALFQVSDGSGPSRLYPYFANDSLKKLPPGEGTSYFRLTNGLPDHPQPTPTVQVYLDDLNGSPLFTIPVTYQEIRNYIVIPSGLHTVYIKSSLDGQLLYTLQKTFVSGLYYSGRLVGRKELGSDQFTIDTE